ncbi:MAG: serine/threonine-protein kinase [Myxococcota bacterium]
MIFDERPDAISGLPFAVDDGPGPDDEPSPLDLAEEVRYRGGGLLGTGGMGEVRVACDRRLDRSVAIKRAAVPHPAAERALLHEATITARLDHPGIVPVLGAGRDAQGRAYYTMPVLQGRTLAERVAVAEGMPTRLPLLRPFLHACEAVAHAHRRGVLHRDLKPDNIQVSEHGGTVVLDWGLACTVDDARTGGGPTGTPGFASPEQSEGRPTDARADVFGLGATLAALLGSDATAIPPELVAIRDKARATDPDHRYADAAALADDVAAWLDGRVVAAHRYDLWSLARRAWRERRTTILIAVTMVAVVSLAVVVGWINTRRERDAAQAAERSAIRARRQSDRHLQRALTAQAMVAAAADRPVNAREAASRALALGPSPQALGVLARYGYGASPRAAGHHSPGSCRRIALSAQGTRSACIDADEARLSTMRGGDTTTIAGHFEDAIIGEQWTVLVASGDTIVAHGPAGVRTHVLDHPPVPIALDGSRALIQRHRRATWLDLDSGTPTMAVDCRPHYVQGLAVSATGSVVAACSDGRLRGTAQPRHLRLEQPEDAGPIVQLATDPEGRRLAVATVHGVITLVDRTTGRVRLEIAHGGSVHTMALHADRLAVSDAEGDVAVYDATTGRRLATLPGPASDLRWLDDRRVLRIAATSVQDWRLPSETLPRRMTSNSGIAAIDISPDGTLVASVHGDGTLRVRRRSDGHVVTHARWQDGVLKDAEFSPDGRHLAVSAAQHAGVSLFDTSTWQRAWLPGPHHYPRLAWLGDDQLLAMAYERVLERWTPDGRFARVESMARNKPEDFELANDGRSALLLSIDGMVQRIDRDGTVTRLADHPDAEAIASGRSVLVIAERDALVVTTPFGDVLRHDLDHGRPVDLAVSPGDEFIAVGHLDGHATLWRTRPLERLAELPGHRQRVSALAFDPAGSFVVTGSWDGDLRFWSLDAIRRDPGPRPGAWIPRVGRTEVLASAELGTTSPRGE